MYKPGQALYKAAKGVDLDRLEFLTAMGEGIGALFLGSVFGSPNRANAFERNPNGYRVPDLRGLTPYKTLYYDVNKRIPGKETLIERFELSNGAKVSRGSVDGRIYAYSIKEPGQNKWYAIIDADGSGLFTEKYGHGELFDVPDWLINLVLAKK